MPIPFNCSPVGYQVAIPAGDNTSHFYQINLVTGLTTEISDTGFNVNAIGYNTLDNLIYGLDSSNDHLIQIDATGNAVDLGAIPNLPRDPDLNYNIGTFDDNGHLYIKNGSTDRYYVIDVDSTSPTYLQLVDPQNGFALDTAPFGNPLVLPIVTDWAYSPIDNLLYTIDNATGNVIRIDPLTGARSTLTTTNVPPNPYGAIFMDANGVLYAIDNDTGRVYKITITGNSANGELFSLAEPSGQNDGASCLNAGIDVDFGDAPDTGAGNGRGNYSTLFANNGPRHQIFDNNLTLGTTVTSENDAYQNATATGDDIPLNTPDDGTTLPLPAIGTTDTTYTIVEDVFNNTGVDALLYAWLDFNQDGIFQLEEAALGTPIVVPSSPALQQINLQFNKPAGSTLTPDETFVRVRLTTDELINRNGGLTQEDTRSLGPAGDGEVEDYLLRVASPPNCPVPQTVDIPSNTQAQGQVVATDPQGETLTYTITTPPQNGTAVINSSTGAWTYTPDTDFVGQDSFVVTVTNQSGLTCTTTITINVNALPPTCPLPQEVETNSNTQVQGQVTATDPQNQTITYTVGTQASNGNVVVNSSTGDWVYTPNTNFVGSDAFTIIATNESGLSCEVRIAVTVNPLAPTCPMPQTDTIAENTQSTGNVTATDAQGQLITYSIDTQATNGLATVNSATGNWTYTPNANFVGTDSFVIRATNESGLSCTVTITVNVIRPDVTLTKVASTGKVQVGETFSYDITATNTGQAFISQAIIKDSLPPSFELVSLALDGQSVTGDLEAGIDIGSLNINESKTLTVTVKVLEVPTPNPYKNVATGEFKAVIDPAKPPVDLEREAVDSINGGNGVEVINPKLTLIKSVSKSPVAVGEVVTYTIVARNDGNVRLDNIVVSDLLDPELEFVSGSVKVNNIARPNDSIISGVNIGSLDPTESSTITFDVKLISQGDGEAQNIASSSFNFIVDPTKPPNSGSSGSNEVIIEIKNPHLTLTKTSDVSSASLGDTINYTVTIFNDGDLPALDVIFKDQLPPSVSLINGSFSVNGDVVNNVDLNAGINIGDIAVGQTVTIKYSVKVVSPDCKGNITNLASANFGYSTTTGGNINRIDSEPTSSEVAQNISLFRQIELENYFCIPNQKPDMEQINDVTGHIEIDDCYVIDTPVGISEEGQQLTGKKLIIHGVLNLVLDYTANVPEQAVHSAEFSMMFSTFIIIPADSNINCQRGIRAEVENIYFAQTSNRSLFINAASIVIASTK